MRSMFDRLRALRSDESGQSLVFGVMSIFLVLFFAAMVMAVGRVSARRIQMQFAADAAAYSSALVESECVNSIALLNTGMAQVRARAMRHAADVNVYGVLAELRDRVMGMNQALSDALDEQISRLQKEIQEETDPGRRESLERELSYLTARLNSLHLDGDPDQKMLEVTDAAFWRQQIAAVQAALDAETDHDRRQELTEQMHHLQAMLNGLHENGDPNAPLLADLGSDPLWVQDIVGVDRADQEYAEAYRRGELWIPAARQWASEMSRLEHTIAILAPYLSAETAYRIARANGGEYVSLFPCSRWLPRDDAYLSLDLFRLGDGWWRVEGGDTTLEVQMMDCGSCRGCNGCGDCEKCWIVSYTKGLSEQGRYRICQLGDRRWYVEDLVRDESACIRQEERISIVTWGPEGVDVVRHDEHDPPWLELINRKGTFPKNTLFVRRVGGTQQGGEVWDERVQAWVTVQSSQGGVVEQARYQWDAKAGQWVMPEEQDFVAVRPGTVTVDGVRLTVTLDPVIPLPGSAVVRTLDPPYVEFVDAAGQPWARAYLKDTTFFEATVNAVDVRVQDDEFRVWKRGQDIWRRSADGRWRTHFDRTEDYWWQQRLTQTGPSHWFYEYMEFGARLEAERNMARLIAHRDVDVEGLTDDEFTSASDLPSWAYDGQMNPDGWLDVAGGTLVKDENGTGEYEHSYKYYQVRPCWDPLDTNNGTEEPDGLWWFDYNHDGRKDDGETTSCPTCGGKGYVVVEPSDVFGRLGMREREPGVNPRRSIVLEDDYQQSVFQSAYMPLVLSEEFLKYGFTAGVWHRTESHFPTGHTSDMPERPLEYLLHDPYPGMKGLMRGPAGQTARQRGEILHPAWGYFAVAGARARLNRPGERDGRGGMEQGVYFSDVYERERWIEENLNNLYLKPGADGWSHWDARLVALNRQVLDEDVLLGLAEPAETGVGWLMQRIAYGSPGGLVPSRQGSLPPGYYRYGDVTGWASDIYGDFDATYDPHAVMSDLTTRVRPRGPYPSLGSPYMERGLLRDPFVEYLSDRPQGEQPSGGQLDYSGLDEDSVVH